MAKISRTRLLDRKINVRDAKLYIIATEGEKTEKQYFVLFKSPRVKVQVIHTEDGLSAPAYVLDRLNAFRNKFDLGIGDELWLMVDVDHRGPKELSAICTGARQSGCQLAISNPCFELWLYLHFLDLLIPNITCRQLEQELRRHLGSYNKTNLDVERYRADIQNAITRAQTLNTNPRERWPNSAGTHVYKVVERIIRSI